MRHINTFAFFIATLFVFSSCQQPDHSVTGSEYMPDMSHSIAYEANTYYTYYFNTWDSASVKKKYDLSRMNKPVNGTIPRGYAGYYLASQNSETGKEARQKKVLDMLNGDKKAGGGISTPANSFAPYYYDDTEEDRLRAISEIRTNPFPISKDGLERGKELYDVFCATCHGEKGDGNGFIYDNGAYPAAPRNFLAKDWVDTTAGVYYHAIMYGKNVMGHYKDKVSYEERWQIIHYIRSLQAKEFKSEYNEDVNTLVPTESTPVSKAVAYNAAFNTPKVIEKPASIEANGHHIENDHSEGDHHSDNHDDHSGSHH